MAERPFRTVLIPSGRTSVSRRLLRRAVLTVIAVRKSEYKATQKKAAERRSPGAALRLQGSPASGTCQS
jgi:hypothetical protein